MARRLLGYVLLADGLLVALFDGGYVRVLRARPLVPDRLVSASMRASDIHPALTRILGVAEAAAGFALIALGRARARRMAEARHRMATKRIERKAA